MKLELNKVIKQFEELIHVVERNEIYKSVIEEIPAAVIGIFPVTSQLKFKSIYADMRIKGNTKEKSLDTASRMILRANPEKSLTPYLFEMQKSLLRIREKLMKGEFFQDSEDAELVITREEIPVIDATEEEPMGGELE
jgi:hypothetical protein